MSGRSLAIDVEVSYRHEGRDYTVWCRSPIGTGFGRGTVQAEQQVARSFPVGSTNPVYVNPRRAGEACLALPEYVWTTAPGGAPASSCPLAVP